MESEKTTMSYTDLKNVGIFSALEQEDLQFVASQVHKKSFSMGDRIVSQGESGEDMYLVLSGSVNVFVRESGRGEDTYLAVIGPGSYFGESVLFNKKTRISTVIAAEATTCGVLNRDSLTAMIENNSKAVCHVLLGICNETFNRMSDAAKALIFTRREQLDQDGVDQLFKH